MSHAQTETVSLTSNWFIRPGCEQAADAALRVLAREVQLEEPDTLTYLVHRPFHDPAQLQSLPPGNPLTVLFFETYRNADAFLRHVNGPVFTQFVQQHGDLFVQSNGKPFTTVEFLETLAGFVRSTDVGASGEVGGGVGELALNRHPGVMFEIIARDQAALKTFYANVFGWHYATGGAGFAYIPFPARINPLLGGIGQAESGTPGYAPGTNFYLRVEDLDTAIARAVECGGQRYVAPVSVDGYTFAMIKDPEGNVIGLIKPF